MALRINAHLGCLGTFSERYVPGGYYEAIDFESALEVMSKIDGLDGLGVWYPGHPYIEDPDKLKAKLMQYGLRVADIGPEIWSDPIFKNGSISSSDARVRKQAIKLIKHTMDLAVELNAYSVLLWPAHDGFDYSFQADYDMAYSHMLESLEEIGQHNPSVKVAIEYKQRDPRAKSYIEDVGKLMFMIANLKATNIGGAMDLGHALFALERPAESIVLLHKFDKLYQVHLNDNYRDGDPDMLFGSVNFWDTLELFYYLKKIGFAGWLNIDTVTPRNDRAKMLELAVKFIKDYERLAEKLLAKSEYIDKNLKDHNFVENMSMIREIIFS